jgi:hypothetical protein
LVSPPFRSTDIPSDYPIITKYGFFDIGYSVLKLNSRSPVVSIGPKYTDWDIFSFPLHRSPGFIHYKAKSQRSNDFFKEMKANYNGFSI